MADVYSEQKMVIVSRWAFEDMGIDILGSTLASASASVYFIP